ncbi:MAG: ATP-dependent DNA helicase RecG [Rickettsia sp.]|nr:ATP-dependent DNA helicase RecG [Rickettsia sp.]
MQNEQLIEKFFFTSIENVLKIQGKNLNALHRLEIFSLRDIVFLKPVDRDIYLNLEKISLDKPFESLVKIYATIRSFQLGRKQNIINVEFDNKNVELIFFNKIPPFLLSVLQLGKKYFVKGKMRLAFGRYQIIHPEFILNPRLVKNIFPKYNLTYGLSSTQLYNYILISLEYMGSFFSKLESFSRLDKYFLWLYKTVKRLHYADMSLNIKQSLSSFNFALKSLAFEELFTNQLAFKNFYFQKNNSYKKKKQIFSNHKLQKQILDILGFELTKEQKIAISEIEKDQISDLPMMRLLQGDVGSGKTIVALLTIINVVFTKKMQAALIAPTDILAQQHYQLFAKLLEHIDLKVEILTGSSKKKHKEIVKKDLLNNKISILIGTHSLFQKDVIFHNLAYVIIDEQHRFGVKQRLDLINKSKDADVLIMSATPIPRSLTLAIFGNIKISKLHKVMENISQVRTSLISIEKKKEIILSISKKIENGHRSFWVCPFVEKSENNEIFSHVISVKERYEELVQYYPGKVGLIHGSMKQAEQDLVLNKFIKGEFMLLVSTTVIEVGIDIKSVGFIVIENAERFGLSQLHQLRGRVGRDGTKADCILLYNKKFLSLEGKKRLFVMKNTNDGFLIAQKDLEIRGHGEIMGLKQSGQARFFFVDLVKDHFMVERAEIRSQKELNSTFSDFKIKVFLKGNFVYIKSL